MKIRCAEQISTMDAARNLGYEAWLMKPRPWPKSGIKTELSTYGMELR